MRYYILARNHKSAIEFITYERNTGFSIPVNRWQYFYCPEVMDGISDCVIVIADDFTQHRYCIGIFMKVLQASIMLNVRVQGNIHTINTLMQMCREESAKEAMSCVDPKDSTL